MTRRHNAVVILLPVADFERLDADAEAHGHETYLHAHWIVANYLGLPMPSDVVLDRPVGDEGER